jgi:hypothetical protein
MNKRIIGIDNGVTGSFAIITYLGTFCWAMPVIKCLDSALRKILYSPTSYVKEIAVIERPMVNPARWKATMSAIRCLEATLVILEDLGIPYQFIDSKEWQKKMLPSGLHKEELKEASYQVAKRLFPTVEFKDGDSLLIAEYARKYL